MKPCKATDKTLDIPKANRGLDCIAITPLVITVIADVIWIEGLHEAEGPVVNGEAERREIVGVHDAVHKPYTHPVRHKAGRFASNEG